MHYGTIKHFEPACEFGFIVRDGHEDEPAIFFHVSGFGEIFVFPGEVQKGKRVVFEIENGERGRDGAALRSRALLRKTKAPASAESGRG